MTKRPSAPSAPAVDTPSQPPRETIVIARGPNEHGHDHAVTSAQNADLSDERARQASGAADRSRDYPPTGEEE